MIIPPTWNLPPEVKVRLSQTTYGRQRAILEEGHLLLILHKPPGPDDSAREGLLFWRTPSGEWQFSRGGPGPGALRRHLQSYAELETRLSAAYQAATTTEQLFDLQEQLTPLARAGRNMHDALQTARDGIQGDTYLIEMRDQAYDIDRNLGLLLEDVRNAIQYKTAREAEEQAKLGREALRASHRLNMLAALFFPLTALTSVFGMNTSSGLNPENPVVFWTVFLIGGLLGFGLKAWVMGGQTADKPKPAPRSES